MKKFTIGKNYTISFNVDKNLIDDFTNFSQDFNPIHLQTDVARRFGYPKPVAHGAILICKISQLIGMKIPGSGAVWLSQEIKWTNPVFLDDHIKVIVEIKSFSAGTRVLELQTTAINQNNVIVMDGMAKVKVGVELSSKYLRKKSMTALVTGGSGAIGSAICERLARSGYDLLVVYRGNVTKLAPLKKRIEKFNVKCKFVEIDLMDQMIKWKKKLLSHGPIDIFVHCASSNLNLGKVEDIDIEDLRKQMRIGCESAVEIVNIITPEMIKKIWRD